MKAVQEEPVKRKRGRPRKNPIPEEGESQPTTKKAKTTTKKSTPKKPTPKKSKSKKGDDVITEEQDEHIEDTVIAEEPEAEAKPKEVVLGPNGKPPRVYKTKNYKYVKKERKPPASKIPKYGIFS